MSDDIKNNLQCLLFEGSKITTKPFFKSRNKNLSEE